MVDYRIMITGPLFNPKEREEELEIATALEKEGFLTYLPQRDGLLFADIVGTLKNPTEEKKKAIMELIGHYDAYNAADKCDGCVLNLNGRVPDEGALVEGAFSFARGKYLVAYKNDGRSLIQGFDNPLVSILSGFDLIDSVEKIPGEFRRLIAQGKRFSLDDVLEKSREVFTEDKYEAEDLAALAIKHFMWKD